MEPIYTYIYGTIYHYIEPLSQLFDMETNDSDFQKIINFG